MIGLLIDAAIAVVTILDRACSAVEAARPGHSPVRSERATSPGAGTASASSAGAGGHPSNVMDSAGSVIGTPAGWQDTQDCTPGGQHTEPLAWGPDGSEIDPHAELDSWRETAEILGKQVEIGAWLIAEARHERDESRAGQPRRNY